MELNANLAYWSGALANLCVIVACASTGVRCIRRGEVRSHKRMMLTASTLVGFFLVSYVVKVMLLGKEDVATSSDVADKPRNSAKIAWRDLSITLTSTLRRPRCDIPITTSSIPSCAPHCRI